MAREWHQAVAGNTLFFQALLAAEIEQVDDECRVGHFPGEFDNLHNLGIDSKGNIYTAEVQGKRVQRFRNMGGL